MIVDQLTVTQNVLQGSGLKHGRVPTGNVPANTTVNVILTWQGLPFGDTSYTVFANMQSNNQNLFVNNIVSYSSTQVIISCTNADGANPSTGIVHVIGMHD